MTAVLIALFAKSAVVAGFALAMTALLRRNTAADRADILRAAVLVLLILPPVALFGPDLAVRVLEPAPVLQSVAPQTIQAAVPLPRTTVSARIILPSPWIWAVALWGLGAVLILGRFGLGMATLAHWSRRGRRVDQADWRAALHRLAPARQPRLRVSPAVAAPLSWGLSPGRILIGPDQLDRPDQAEAVLAHELAHIRRADWLFLALSRITVALFWFNPLVWLAARELERLSEQAVDEAVVRRIDRETYARTLVGLAAQITKSSPNGAAVSMTGPARSLAERIKTVMSDRTPTPSRPWMVAVAVAALAIVATPIAALELAARAQDQAASPAPAEPRARAVSADADGDRRVHRTIITHNGQTTRYVVNGDEAYALNADGARRPMTDEERRDVQQAREDAQAAAQQARETAAEARVHAREQAMHARAMAAEAQAMAADARAQAQVAEHMRSVDHAAIREQAAQAAAEARVHAARALVDARRAREQAVRAMASARVEMARGADEMDNGARQMRDEAQRLRDPAYRAQQIEQERRDGRTVTDRQLLDAIPKMLSGADRMEEGAARMRESARARD
ncbi:M56 family metallopeptidase [Brevundimonas sp.]|uniref:M56 family metallopeptidase n=1 Tax=Brevundimonas sp. TaxID=1871086 RepID=UPI002FD989F0